MHGSIDRKKKTCMMQREGGVACAEGRGACVCQWINAPMSDLNLPKAARMKDGGAAAGAAAAGAAAAAAWAAAATSRGGGFLWMKSNTACACAKVQ